MLYNVERRLTHGISSREQGRGTYESLAKANAALRRLYLDDRSRPRDEWEITTDENGCDRYRHKSSKHNEGTLLLYIMCIDPRDSLSVRNNSLVNNSELLEELLIELLHQILV